MSVPETQLAPAIDPTPPPTAPPQATWESASEVAAPPVIVDPPVSEPAPTTPLEKPDAAPLVAEPPPVRESEVAPDSEKVIPDPNDPPEIQAITGEGGKRWARRQFQDAAPIRAFDDLDEPISKVGDDLYKRSESRYWELAEDFLKSHVDYFAQRMFGMPYKEAKEKFTATPTAPAPVTTVPDNTKLLTPAELDALTNEQIVERFQASETAKQQAIEAARQEAATQFQAKEAILQKRLEDLEGKVTTREKQEIQTKYKDETQKLYNKVWDTVIEGGIRDSGLEVKSDDPPKIANLKNAAAKLLRTDSEPTFDKDESNQKVLKTAVKFAERGEFQNMWREEDNLTVRARTAFESVKQSAELQAIIGEIEAYAKSKTSTRAASPAPPVPGSAAGVTIKPPSTWAEAEAAPNVLSA